MERPLLVQQYYTRYYCLYMLESFSPIISLEFHSVPSSKNTHHVEIEQVSIQKERERSHDACENLTHAVCGVVVRLSNYHGDAQGRTAPKVAAPPAGQRGGSSAY